MVAGSNRGDPVLRFISFRIRIKDFMENAPSGLCWIRVNFCTDRTILVESDYFLGLRPDVLVK